MDKILKNMYKKETKVDSIYSDSEFGFLKEKSVDVDMTSLESDVYDVYMPNKHLSISSKKNVYEFLWKALNYIK